MSLDAIALLSAVDREAYADRLARELLRPVSIYRRDRFHGVASSEEDIAVRTNRFEFAEAI